MNRLTRRTPVVLNNKNPEHDDDQMFSNPDCNICCTYFGQGRHMKYPGIYFSIHVTYGKMEEDKNKRSKRSQKKYKCVGGHTSRILPTTVNTNYMQILQPRNAPDDFETNISRNSNATDNTSNSENSTSLEMENCEEISELSDFDDSSYSDGNSDFSSRATVENDQDRQEEKF